MVGLVTLFKIQLNIVTMQKYKRLLQTKQIAQYLFGFQIFFGMQIIFYAFCVK